MIEPPRLRFFQAVRLRKRRPRDLAYYGIKLVLLPLARARRRQLRDKIGRAHV